MKTTNKHTGTENREVVMECEEDKMGQRIDYTVEVRNRFKGLDLIGRVPDELWNEVRDIVQETGSKTIPTENKSKMAVWGGLTNSCEKKRGEKQRRKGNI